MLRRDFVLLTLGAAAAASPAFAQQPQAYPSRPIRMIIPSTPGGGTDFVGRLVSTRLAEMNGWAMVPDNKPGAGTALGLAEAARSSNAGYDLVIAQTDNVTLIPLVMKAAYDPIRDLTPVALVATTPLVLIVPEASPYKTLGDLVNAAKAQPGKLSYGSSGTGGSAHIAVEMFQAAAGVKFQHIPYKGSSPALADLVGGHVQFVGSSIASAESLIKAGKVRALAVSSVTRSPALPSVPTVAESGYRDYSFSTYYGVMAPAGLPQPVQARLNADINTLLQRQDVRAAMLAQGLEPAPSSIDDFAARMRADIQKAKATISAANITVE